MTRRCKAATGGLHGFSGDTGGACAAYSLGMCVQQPGTCCGRSCFFLGAHGPSFPAPSSPHDGVQVESIKWVPGTDFIVDGFAFKNPRCSPYFLTHFHSDHTVGLNK